MLELKEAIEERLEQEKEQHAEMERAHAEKKKADIEEISRQRDVMRVKLLTLAPPNTAAAETTTKGGH